MTLGDAQALCAAPDAAPARKPRRGDRIELEVAGFAAGGGLYARYSDESGDYKVSLRRGVPGERALALVLMRRGHDLRARIETVLAPSPFAVAPRCVHLPDCGGCAHQDLGYAAQLDHKRLAAERILNGVLSLGSLPPVEAPIGCPEPWRYRNKMDFTFGTRRWIVAGEAQDLEPDERDFALGLHPFGQFAKVLDVRTCEIVFPQAEPILAGARELARAQGLGAWDLRLQAGLLRHLVLRRSEARGEILLNLVTDAEAPERVGPYVSALLARHPEITTCVQTVHTGLAKTALGEREIVLHGPGYIVEELGGFAFRLSARSFFQTNTPQAERLLELVLAAAAASSDQVVYDLYCGVGSLTLPLARRAGRVIGFELVEPAVADARGNALRNGLGHVEFVAGDVLETLAQPGLPRPDVLVVDPPRGGLHPKVADALAATGATRLVYVSCNLESAARDTVRLALQGWRLTRIQPIDLFPHTPHLESVLTLERGA